MSVNLYETKIDDILPAQDTTLDHLTYLAHVARWSPN
jgi:hypothetical protein